MSEMLSRCAPKSVHQLKRLAVYPSSMSETAAAINNGKNQKASGACDVKDRIMMASAAKSLTLVIILGMFFISQAYKVGFMQ